MSLPTSALLLNFISTLFMTGVIWYVQIVHYPLFSRVSSDTFREYERLHSNLTTAVVILPMLVELVTALYLCWQRPNEVSASEAVLGAALLGIIWFSTMFIQVPKHAQLSAGFDEKIHQALVATNWIRTLLWSARSVLVSWCILKMLK
ncbi:MAG: hypothetical protein ACK42Y_08790 [Candidatus Thermochlorobacter sp.]